MRWWCLLHEPEPGARAFNFTLLRVSEKKFLTLDFVNIKYQPCGRSQHSSELVKHILEAIPSEVVLSSGVI